MSGVLVLICQRPSIFSKRQLTSSLPEGRGSWRLRMILRSASPLSRGGLGWALNLALCWVSAAVLDTANGTDASQLAGLFLFGY